MTLDDDRESIFVSSFANAPIRRFLRGNGGAADAAHDRRLVYIFSTLAIIPIVGIIFAAIAFLVAVLDVVSGQRRARLELFVASVAICVAFASTAVVSN